MLSKLVVNKGQDWDRLLEPLLFVYRTTPHSSTGKTPFFLLYGQDAKLSTTLEFYSSHPKTPVIYSEYGKTLFKEIKLIRDIAIKNIQQAQSSQKRQFGKSSCLVSIEVGGTVFVKVQPKFKLDHNFHGPFRVYKVTGNNAKVKLTTNPDVESRTLSLQQISKCRGSFSTNQSWLSHNITKPRRCITDRKRISKYPTSNVNPGTEQTNALVYRTQYGRKVNPPERF